MGPFGQFNTGGSSGMDATSRGGPGAVKHVRDAEPVRSAESNVAFCGLDKPHCSRRVAVREAGAPSGRRTQRRDYDVGMVHAEGVSTRRDLYGQTQSTS